MSVIVPNRRTINSATSRGLSQPPPIPRPSQQPSGGYLYLPEDSLKVAAVQACVGLRAGALAQLPLKGYADVNGVPTMLPTQPELLAHPSSVVVQSVWKTQMSVSRDLWGFAAGHITALDGAGYPARVEWYPPEVVHAEQRNVGAPIEWRVGGQHIDGSLIFHVPSRWVLPGRPLGISPLENGGLVDLAIRCQDFGRDWFAKGAIPSAIIYADEVMNSEQADDLLSKLIGRWRRRQPGILGSGLKYEQVSVKANESQFLETATRVAADVAISFNMPPEKIGAAVAGQSITYANRDQAQQQYLIDSINPDLVVVQEVIGQHMRPDTYARWNTSAFLRSDLKTRYEAARIAIASGFMHPDEVRALEELPPLTPEQLATMPMISAPPISGGSQ